MEIVPLADKKEFIAELAELHHLEWMHLNPSLTLEGRAEKIAEAAEREGIPSVFIAVSGSQLVRLQLCAALKECTLFNSFLPRSGCVQQSCEERTTISSGVEPARAASDRFL